MWLGLPINFLSSLVYIRINMLQFFPTCTPKSWLASLLPNVIFIVYFGVNITCDRT